MSANENTWRTLPLSELLTRITYGFTNPMPTTKDGPYMITAKDIRGGRIDLDSARRTSWEAYHNRLTDKSRPCVGDVLLTKDGSIGRVAVCDVPNICINQSVALLQLNDLAMPQFLAYLLQSPTYQAKMEADSDGSTIKHIYITRVDKMTVSVPDLQEQAAICSVLGALDDKIAANSKVIDRTLSLIGAKFQHARSHCALTESTYAETALVGGGGTPRTSFDAYWGGNVPWATPTDVTNLPAPYITSTGRTITEAGLAATSSQLYPAGSILMTSRATIGAFAVAQVPIAVNQGFIVVNAKNPELQWWLFHDMRVRVTEFLSYANGATFLELSKGKFKQLAVALPPPDVAAEFSAQASALHGMASATAVENVELARTRDELLPLLMSGRIRVKDAEARVSEVV